MMLDGVGEDFRWYVDIVLNNNELFGIVKVVYRLIFFYFCLGEFFNWLLGC